MSEPVYYRLFIDRDDNPVVVCMQQFDEHDYDQSRFINEERYNSEEEAEQALLAIKVKSGMSLSTLERLRMAAAVNEQSLYQGAIDGIRVIPAEDVPPGFKRTAEVDIFVNPQSYEYMRPLSARGVIVALGALREDATT